MYKFNSRVRYSETGKDGRLSLTGLLNYFQDCSFFDSENAGVGHSYLKEKNVGWVLSSWQVAVDRYPSFGEEVRVGTAPYDFRGYLGYRNFLLETKEGQRLAVANSIWTLLDTKNMRPVKADSELIKAYRIEEKLPMEYAPRKIDFAGDGISGSPIVVQEHHLDTNFHVNNGQYISMAMDCMEGNPVIVQMRAEYKKPAVKNAVILPYIIRKSEDIIIVLLRNEEKEPYCIVEFKVVQQV